MFQIIRSLLVKGALFGFAVAMVILTAPASVHAAHFSLVGIGVFSKQAFDPSTISQSGLTATLDGSAKLGLGGGALVGFSLVPSLELETGALYMTRKYEMKTSALGLTQTDTFTQHAIQIPLLLRANLARYFSIGAGGYAAMGTGDVKDEEVSMTGVSSTSETNYATMGLKNRDYGLLFSAALHLPIAARTRLLVDGRYALGLTDVNENFLKGAKVKYRDVQILAGFQFGMPGSGR